MKRLAATALFVALALPAGCSLINAYPDLDEAIACTSAAACPAPSSDCVEALCSAEGSCEERPLTDDSGLPIEPAQIAGDCTRAVCREDGTLLQEPEDLDVPDDLLCELAYSCEDGELSSTVVQAGAACFDEGSEGVCVEDGAGLSCQFDCDATHPCPNSANPCLVRTCNFVTNKCDDELLDNVPSPGDALGDCQFAFCLAGQEDVVVDNSDVPDDDICSDGICTNGVPEQVPHGAGVGCIAGPDQEVCDGAGNCVECNDAAACEQLPADTECGYRACVNNLCVYESEPNGHVVAGQVTGDCKDVVCDGNGNIQIVNNDSDSPHDNNVCTSDVCSGGTPSNPPCCSNQPCPAGVCNASGQCAGCNNAGHCGANTACMWWTCDSQVCNQNFHPSGTLVTTNPSGDCQRQVCDGVGNTIFAPDDDPPPPPSQNPECQYYTCSAGTAQLVNRNNGTDCTDDSAFCNGDEICSGGSCNSPGNPCAGHSTGPSCNDSCDEGANDCGGNDPAGTLCGSGANTQCDNPDSCNSSGVCLPNNESNGTPCDDGTFCNGSDTCGGGSCSTHAGDPCDGADNDADCSETCREAQDDCNGNDPNGSSCNGGAGSCSSGSCQ